MPDDCPECQEQKAEAEVRARATADSSDGLRLGECAPLYQLWADCIEKENGQAKACVTVLKQFKECHDASTQRALQLRPPR
jgi:hypothetical protein